MLDKLTISLACSLAPVIIFRFMLRNEPLSLLYSASIGLVTFLFLWTIMNRNSRPIITLTINSRLSIIAFVLLTFFSTAVLLNAQNTPVTIYNGPIANVIENFSQLDVLEIVVSYLVVYVLPGVAILTIINGSLQVKMIEKPGIWILFSFIFSSVITLTLSYFHIFSTEIYLLLLWSAVIASVLKAVRADPRCTSPVSLDYGSILVVATIATICIMAYFMILTEEHFTGITSGDIRYYSSFANVMVNLEGIARVPYVWFSIPQWLVSTLAGLPFLYTLALAQFVIIVLPTAVYFFIRSVLVSSKILPSTTILFLFLGLGITVAYSFSLFLINPSTIEVYFGLENQQLLTNFFNTTGAPGITPLAVAPVVFDLSMTLIASALYYSQIVHGSNLTKSIIAAVLLSSAIFTHSLNSALYFIILLLVGALVRREYLRISAQIVLFATLSTALLEPISGYFLFGKFFPSLQDHFLPLVIAVLLYLAVIFFRYSPHTLRRLRQISPLLSNLKSSISINKSSILSIEKKLFVVGVVFFSVNIFLFLTDNTINYTSIWYQETSVLPVSLLTVKFYGPLLMFAVPGMHLLYVNNKTAFAFVMVFISSSFAAMSLSLLLTDIIPPSIFFTRYAMYPAIPIIGISLMFAFKKIEANSRYARVGTAAALVVILLLASMSHAYSRELFVVWGERRSLTEVDVSTVNWFNEHAEPNTRVVVFGDSSEILLTNLSQNLAVVPLSHSYSSSWYKQSWISDILFSSQSNDVSWYVFSRMNVSYILVRNSELQLEDGSNARIFSAISSYPIVYHKESSAPRSSATIYKIPTFGIIEGAPNVLVKPTRCLDHNFDLLFNKLVSSGIGFDEVNDIDLSAGKSIEGQTFLFSDTCYNVPLDTLLQGLPSSTTKIIAKSDNGAAEPIVVPKVFSMGSPHVYEIHDIGKIDLDEFTNLLYVGKYSGKSKQYSYPDDLINTVVPSVQSAYLTERLRDTGIFKSIRMMGDIEISSERVFEFRNGISEVRDNVHTLYQNAIVEAHSNGSGDYTTIEILQQSSKGERVVDTLWLENPSFVIHGKINGLGQVVVPSINHYSSDFDEISFQGDFTLSILENSGLIYAQISPS